MGAYQCPQGLGNHFTDPDPSAGPIETNLCDQTSDGRREKRLFGWRVLYRSSSLGRLTMAVWYDGGSSSKGRKMTQIQVFIWAVTSEQPLLSFHFRNTAALFVAFFFFLQQAKISTAACPAAPHCFSYAGRKVLQKEDA